MELIKETRTKNAYGKQTGVYTEVVELDQKPEPHTEPTSGLGNKPSDVRYFAGTGRILVDEETFQKYWEFPEIIELPELPELSEESKRLLKWGEENGVF